MLDVDLVQRLKVGALFLIQSYKIVTGTMLALFVPQSCGKEICTIQENYKNEDPYHKLSLYINFASMSLFFISYIFELRRENWAIEYLDIDNDKPDNALKEIIQSEPVLDKKMDRLNKIYMYILIATGFVYFVNISVMWKILYTRYHSMSTISCFISFVLLVIIKLYNSLSISYQSVRNDKMLSAYMTEFVSFNVLDVDYLANKEKKKEENFNSLEDITNP